jgi:hypothetical protein
MMLPQNYGNTYQPAIRKGQLNGPILDTITQAQRAVDNYEKQSEELAKTQQKAQLLITMGTVTLMLGGIFIGYKLLTLKSSK